MKEKIRSISIIVISVCVFIFVYMKLDHLLMGKESVEKYDEFYQEEGEYDILFFGSSHMMNTIYPMELWKRYGFTSYNLGNPTEAIPGTYWVLKNAIKYKKPKVVVIDCFITGYFKVFPDKESFSHMFFDTLPISKDKIAAIEDLLPEQKEEFLWPFSLYHNRWNELSKKDFLTDTVSYKGAEILTGYSNMAGVTYTDESTEVNGMIAEYIGLIKGLCDDNDIELILCCVPYAAMESEQQAHNGFHRLADEMEIRYLDLIPAGVVDYEIDMQDRGHLNSSGARKVTEYMGKWISDNCNIGSRTSSGEWNDDYKQYIQYKSDLIKSQTNLYAELLLLHDKDFRASIALKDKDILLQDPILDKMIDNVTDRDLEYVIDEASDVRIKVFYDGEMIDDKCFDVKEEVDRSYVRVEE